jgi:hypothetical protein
MNPITTSCNNLNTNTSTNTNTNTTTKRSASFPAFFLHDAPVKAIASHYSRLPAEKSQTTKGPRQLEINFSGSSSNAFAAPPTFAGYIILKRKNTFIFRR